jgi:hypothetical protein
MRLGFTGTREDPTKEQKKWFLSYVLGSGDDETIDEFHHGCCEGSDEFSHRVARQCSDLTVGQIVLHPPSNSKHEMKYEDWDYANCVWYPKKPYFDRNYDIVDCSTQMVALPKGPEVQRGSGTWHTIRAAIRAKKPVIICWPNGEVEMRGTK